MVMLRTVLCNIGDDQFTNDISFRACRYHIELRIYKKPFWFIFLIIGVTISPLAVIIGNALYGIIAFCINAFPNKNLLDYGLIQQIKDISTPFFISGIIFLTLQKMQIILPHTLFFLIVEGIVGVIIYFFVSKFFRLKGAKYIQDFIVNRIRRKAS